ncbi:DUF4974 domain-containing protein [Chitinophaga silvatica]|uniref:DUF4974 domain-containing protein n=1 Tax=Chitinophaga silvatica TaxID=2282649 RepID=A0A3E1Y272_9BACT|nr:FecR family protein [Chitinophaga silvatica]RFS18761.1 DUF4974 domain-containing protein [Chitinophaga silvatica]
MEKEEIIYLIKGYANNSLNEAELQTFFNEVIKEENKELYQEVAATLLEEAPVLDSFDEKLWPLFERVLQVDRPAIKEEVPKVNHFLRKWGWAAAAAVIFCIGLGAYFLTANRNIAPVALKTEITPGKNGAILMLADGSKVVLDSLGNGIVASQNGAQVALKNGELTYDQVGNVSGEMVYNTMTTPKGREFRITLPDGTQVWLNSASSIRYPTIFTGAERKVEVNGEAYFEVTKNEKQPFRVIVNNRVEIEVLGTHFNVNAYRNEEIIKTTLLEGSVRVNGIVIRPGQQAQVAESVYVVSNPDIDKVMAWKNGLFYFEGSTLAEIMRQVERWYDIEVVYENGIPVREFEGKMTRGVSLDGLLMVLQKLGVHYRLEGRKLFIMP